jgi:hypothetical protein
MRRDAKHQPVSVKDLALNLPSSVKLLAQGHLA